MKKISLFIFLIIFFPLNGYAFDPTLVFAGSTVAGTGSGGTVSFVGTAIGTDTDGTCSATPHASTSSGDLMVAYAFSDTAASQGITWPSGWSATITSVTSSSSMGFIATKTAGADESSPYDFVFDQAGGEIVTITTFSKDAGTWNVSDNATSNAQAVVTLDSGPIDISAGGALYVGWGNDDSWGFNGTPSGMTTLGHTEHPATSMRISDWYQLYAGSGSAVTKTNTVLSNSDLSTIAIAIEAQ